MSQPWSLRLWLAVALMGIVAVAVFSAAMAISIAETARNDAAAINKAGSLRMQAYRLAASLRADTGDEVISRRLQSFRETLRAPALRQTANGGGAVVAERYRTIAETWANELEPALHGSAQDHGLYLDRVEGFVTSVDAMVNALQAQAEQRIVRLRVSQAAALTVALLLAALAAYLIQARVASPLRGLISAAERVRGGELGARADHKSQDELGVLASSFNTMAQSLEALQQDLEQQVADRTRELRDSNCALQLLYDTTSGLVPGHVDSATLAPILARLEEYLGTGPVTIVLQNRETGATEQRYVAGTRTSPDTDSTARSGATTALAIERQGHHHGWLLIAHNPGAEPDGGQRQLAATVATKIASTLELEREARYQRRLDLLEERNAIARELHDSLAQSLSYLKIQVTRLEAGIGPETTSAQTRSVLQDLREGLNTAYGHLREILSTFRLRMDEDNLPAALQAAVNEFQQRPGAPSIHLDAPHSGPDLDANAEIHVVHIVREALANAVNHSGADNVWVRLSALSNSRVNLTIEDDGRGLPETSERPHHYGMRIMAERAHSLGGSLSVSTRAPQGTRIAIQFVRTASSETEPSA